MERSAVILAGGSSKRFGEDKGILLLANKPLLKHVIDRIRPVVSEIIVVTNSRERVKEYRSIVGEHVRLVVDQGIFTGPLVGALTGFSGANGTLSMLLPFDTPFVSQEVASLLFELCHSKAAVIPRWPNSQIEPLQAVYDTTLALEAAKAALAAGRMDMRGMIERIHGVRFVSTLVISQLDPDLQTFFNVNNRNDLVKASMMIKHRISI